MAGNSYKIEDIPNQDQLFMRVHKNLLISLIDTELDDYIPPNILRSYEGSMSTDWSKYSTPEQTKQRGRNPIDNGVIELGVGQIRGIPSLKVAHSPLVDNRAHTDVLGITNGPKLVTIRRKLARIAKWSIKPRE